MRAVDIDKEKAIRNLNNIINYIKESKKIINFEGRLQRKLINDEVEDANEQWLRHKKPSHLTISFNITLLDKE